MVIHAQACGMGGDRNPIPVGFKCAQGMLCECVEYESEVV